MKLDNSRMWLFSFADLAFLLLIAFTQASTIGKKPVHIGEMMIPKVVTNKNVSSIVQPVESHQIRVLKPTIPETNPYLFVTMAGDKEKYKSKTLSSIGLKNQLELLKQQGKQRPILVPDIYSLSKDTLMAMSIIEKVYEDANRVTIHRTGGLE